MSEHAERLREALTAIEHSDFCSSRSRKMPQPCDCGAEVKRTAVLDVVEALLVKANQLGQVYADWNITTSDIEAKRIAARLLGRSETDVAEYRKGATE